jgi:hypothetical protein
MAGVGKTGLADEAHLRDGASATLLYQLAATRSTFVVLALRTSESAPTR